MSFEVEGGAVASTMLFAIEHAVGHAISITSIRL
jgi:hypothetical protein